nr:FGGY-family carbohydrate kinase [Amycolatopsis marina]
MPYTAKVALLGLDVGTSAVKAGLFTPDGVALHRHRAALNVMSPHPGHLELDADEVWDSVASAARAVLARADGLSVEAIGVAAAAPTPLLIDRDGLAVSPICTFADARAAGDLASFVERVDVEAYQRLTGNPIAVPTCSVLTGLRLASTLASEPLWFGHLASLVVYRLTGRWVMDPTNAAFTGALDIAQPDTWSSEAVSLLGAPSLRLPELVPSAEAAGRLTDDAMRQLGLSSSAVVAAGCADTAAAALAVACVENGDAFESVGTSGVLTVCRDKPPVAMHAMNRPHVVPGRWLSHAAMSSSGAAVSWLRERVLPDTPNARSLADINELAESAPPGCGGVVFLPYLAGERSPVWDSTARGAWVGMSLETTASHLTRSVFEGAAYGLRQLLDLETGLTGEAVTELLSVGGGTNSAFWSSIKADVTGRVIHRAANGDVAARGAALLAACALGLHNGPLAAARSAAGIPTSRVDPSTVTSIRETYDVMYGVYIRLYPALKPLFASLKNADRHEMGPDAVHQPTDTPITNLEGDCCVESP